jgi:hypothetical protein
MTLFEIVKFLPKDTQLTFRVGDLCDMLAVHEIINKPHDKNWISSERASEILNTSARTLRKKAEGWHRIMARGELPVIRVRKTGGSDRSPWQFNELDCENMAVEMGNPIVKKPIDTDGSIHEYFASRIKTS